MSEVDDILKRIEGHKGVLGVIILNNDGSHQFYIEMILLIT